MPYIVPTVFPESVYEQATDALDLLESQGSSEFSGNGQKQYEEELKAREKAAENKNKLDDILSKIDKQK